MSDIRETKGLIATVVTSDIKHQFSQALSDMRDYNSRSGFVNIEYRHFEAKLVEAGRDSVARHAKEQKYDWFFMIDADAGPFPHDATERMLRNMFVDMPHLHVLGAYANLKQKPYLPTIDTGTGLWEIHFPGHGVLPVIRTGGHFLMVKTMILQYFGPPWFRTRIPRQPSQAFADLDNFARTKLSGKNPLRNHPEWDTLVKEAVKVSVPENTTSIHIGEDSGFCDAVRAVGGIIGVDTDLVVGHIGNRIIGPNDLKQEIDKQRIQTYQRLGVLDYD